MNIPATSVVAHQRLFAPGLFGSGIIGPVWVEHFVEFLVESHGSKLFVRRPEVFEPPVGADVKSLARPDLRLSSHHLPLIAPRGDLVINQPRLPGVKAVRAAIDVLGQRALETRGRNVFQNVERLDLLIQIARGRGASDDLRDELKDGLRWIASDARLGLVEMIPAALTRLGALPFLT